MKTRHYKNSVNLETAIIIAVKSLPGILVPQTTVPDSSPGSSGFQYCRCLRNEPADGGSSLSLSLPKGMKINLDFFSIIIISYNY